MKPLALALALALARARARVPEASRTGSRPVTQKIVQICSTKAKLYDRWRRSGEHTRADATRTTSASNNAIVSRLIASTAPRRSALDGRRRLEAVTELPSHASLAMAPGQVHSRTSFACAAYNNQQSSCGVLREIVAVKA